MRIKSQDEILDLATRKAIIDEINGNENKERKNEAWRRYRCFKDQTDRYVMEILLQNFDWDTVKEMQYALSNISITKKVIEKLARVYSNGVSRVAIDANGVPQENETDTLEALAKELDGDTALKKTNRFLKLQRNLALYIKPCPIIQSNGSFLWDVKLQPLNPYLYDVVEDFYDRTRPVAFILSNYSPKATADYTTRSAASEGRSYNSVVPKPDSNKKDDIIADKDLETGHYIWWSDKYHFTTNEKGEIIANLAGSDDLTNISNPIQELPFVNFAIDQDGSFWAEGGKDLIDGAILVNSMISNINHIGVTQGYGQAFMKGTNLPRNVKVGPNKIMLMEYTKEDPVPEFGFVSASPDLDKLRNLVDMYVALLLTTNNLSTTGIQTQLSGGGVSLPSGIALMIDKAESREDVQDQEQIFKDKEYFIWKKASKWIDVYADSIVPNLRGLVLPDDIDVSVSFNAPQVIMSESEKLDALAKRSDLGISTKIDLIKMDNPGISTEEAQAKLEEILREKMLSFSREITPRSEENNQDDAKEDLNEGLAN